jgi:MFS family permease
MADYFDIRHLFALVALFHFLLLAVFLIQPNYWSMLIFASIFGAAVGGIYPVWTTLTAAAFGAPSFGAVFGFMAPFMQIMSIVFVRFIGEVHSRTGSYDLAFQFFIFTVILAAGFIYAMRLPGKQEIGIKRDKPATS